ncbi:hypothetical protein MKY91_20275 [Alkalicoccobacillus gibsonii]|uniref:Uncharacterized protein n=1 Tax=Alkalicoccobacillus gibsonii TaxID=79881 RepID=A0ABU9VNV5_9BACI
MNEAQINELRDKVFKRAIIESLEKELKKIHSEIEAIYNNYCPNIYQRDEFHQLLIESFFSYFAKEGGYTFDVEHFSAKTPTQIKDTLLEKVVENLQISTVFNTEKKDTTEKEKPKNNRDGLF